MLLTDSDWATCPRTRRSKTGGVLYHGSHAVGFWCKLQDRVATSSGVAELKAVCKGYSELILLRHIVGFLRQDAVKLSVHGTDANACRGILLRHGAGPVKWLSVRQLWVQELIKDYGIEVNKISREDNTADFLCSPGKEQQLDERLAELGCWVMATLSLMR